MKTTINITGIALVTLLFSCSDPHKEKKEEATISNMDITTLDLEMDLSAPAACMAPPGEVNTEEYAALEEEGFKSTTHSPYSTFSIDVDGASYSNARRMLMEGVLPPTDAIRVEEWINYFSYSYPNPLGKDPFSITTEYSDCPWNTNHKLLQIGLKGKDIEAYNSKPNNLVFLIDVSGSMEDADKLPLLKRAFKLLVPKMRKQDRISMVVYAGAAGVVLNSESGKNKEEILNALENLEAGGSTAGGEGIELAYHIAEENYMEDGNNRVILATDGDFNVGISKTSELENFIQKKRSKGIYLSVIGFGEGNIKDNNMEVLADKGNGNYFYIDNILEAKKVLVDQFGGTINTIAKDVKLQVEFNPAYVKEYRLIGYENRRLNPEDFNDDKKDAGELGSGHMVTALYEIVTTNSKEQNVKIDALKYQNTNTNSTDHLELATIKFRYKAPAKNDTTSKLIQKTVYNYSIPINQASANYKLASGVSEFALLMRDSEYKNKASFDQAINLAASAKGNDQEGYVSELISLMKIAKTLKQNTAMQ